MVLASCFGNDYTWEIADKFSSTLSCLCTSHKYTVSFDYLNASKWMREEMISCFKSQLACCTFGNKPQDNITLFFSSGFILLKPSGVHMSDNIPISSNEKVRLLNKFLPCYTRLIRPHLKVSSAIPCKAIEDWVMLTLQGIQSSGHKTDSIPIQPVTAPYRETTIHSDW